MKFNKIITSVLAFSMIASTAVSVSAAFDYNVDSDSGMVMVSEMPSKDELKVRTPKLSVDVEKINNADMAKVDAVYNNLYGKKTDTATGNYLYDIYRITYTFTDVGPLALGYADEKAGVGIGAVAVEANFSSVVKASKHKTSSITGLTASHGFDGTQFAYYLLTTDLTNPYPFFGDEQLGAVEKNATITMSDLMVVDAGKTVTFTLDSNKCLVNYSLVAGVTANAVPVLATLSTETTYTLGKSDIAVDSITLDKNSISLDKHDNKAAKLIATVLPVDATDPTVTWSSDNEEVATVDKNGTVTAAGFGKTTIKATAGGKTATCTVTVKAIKNDEIKSTDGTKKIKVLDIPTLRATNKDQFIYITKGEEKRKSAQTIGKILGGEWGEDATVEGTLAVGILTDDLTATFDFVIDD